MKSNLSNQILKLSFSVLIFSLLFVVFSPSVAAQTCFQNYQPEWSQMGKSTNNRLFWDVQKSVLNRRLRLGVLSGALFVDSPISSTDWYYGFSLHTLLFRSPNVEGYLVLEGSHAAGQGTQKIAVDEDEWVEFKSPDTQTYNLNLEMIGISWAAGNPLKIFPFTTLGLGIISRPEKEKMVTRHFGFQETEEVNVVLKDCGKNVASVNLGIGLQIYYLLRIDLQIFLVQESGLAIYRTGVRIVF